MKLKDNALLIGIVSGCIVGTLIVIIDNAINPYKKSNVVERVYNVTKESETHYYEDGSTLSLSTVYYEDGTIDTHTEFTYPVEVNPRSFWYEDEIPNGI